VGPIARACAGTALVWVGVMTGHARPAAGQWVRPTATVTFREGVQVRAEIVDTPPAVERGLMFRESLAPNEGMLFVFEQTGVYPFWMKNTLIPLDMVFIAADGTVRHVHANAVPLSTDTVPSRFPVRAVLEINGGSAALLGIKPGDKVKNAIFGNA